MNPKLTAVKRMNVAGLEIRTANQEEMNPAKAKIPGVWERFYRDALMEKMPGRKPGCVPLGVYSKYETDHTGPYSLLAGVEMSDTDIPAGMAGITISEGPYLVFAARGSMPHSLIQTWISIWNYFSKESKYTRAYTTDFELYLGKDAADIYIAVT